ncbi:ABC transporter substrate-binding protein [Aureimonas mangrovi]|uniref:ABC transporter substrate-binding protein n=1 Tax=Aureimonas mangrovi TaxID=2758041 RepID=UPI00163D4F14|nr:ABC transporter substrate-binding protein [Aureimonas mangrovi]
MHLSRTLTMLTAALALTASAAQAQETLRIGTEGAYAPFNFTNAAGELEGFDIDIARALCDQMEVTCEFVTSDWDGIIPALQNNRFDAIIASMSITPERQQQVLFTNKYYQTPPALIVPRDSEITEASAEAMSGLSVGAQGSTTHSQAAEALFADSDVRIYPTAEEYQLDLENGRLDGAVDDVVVLSEFLDTDAGACCRLVDTLPADPAIYGEGIGIALRLGEDELAERFNAAIDAIRENGTYAEIQDKYFDFDVYGD